MLCHQDLGQLSKCQGGVGMIDLLLNAMHNISVIRDLIETKSLSG
jgi:hypothetical protein